MAEKINISPDFLNSIIQMDEFQEFGLYMNIFRFGIPVLWLLTLVLLWRISDEACLKRAGRQYQCITLILITFSFISYAVSFTLINLELILAFLVVSFLLAAAMSFSNLNRYREEYVD